MTDPTGLLLTGIRDYPAVAAITTKIRCPDPLPGDALGPGSYQRFVVLSRLGAQREKRVPVQEVRYVAKCYGVNAQDTTVLAGAVSDAIHHIGPRVNASGVLIWASFDDGGEGPTADPATGQLHADVVISVTASTQLVTP
jgi:hypothetical protein